jgi:hypothetical protein
VIALLKKKSQKKGLSGLAGLIMAIFKLIVIKVI